MKKFNAFTLAEVLITLGIIGVVAAMTMPTLMNSTNGAQYKTAYKKALSVLSQAVVLNVALDDYDLSQATTTVNDGKDTSSPSLFNLFNNRMNVIKTATDASWNITGGVKADEDSGEAGDPTTFGGSSNNTLFFNDGIVFTFPKDDANCGLAGKSHDELCKGIIDVNGEKNPNQIVTCDKGADDDCIVEKPTDIYPVVMFDQTILPNSPAARAVLYGN